MGKQFTISDLQQSACAAINQHLFAEKENPKRSKYNNVKTEVDGIEFDSRKEAKRFRELKMLLKAGEIGFLARQVEYTFHIEGNKIASYLADFQYTDKNGKTIVEDVKSEATRKLPVYRLKRKMMKSQHGITIKEV